MSNLFAFFPGQGSQHKGMGQSLCENSEIAKNVFECASDISGMDVKKLCFDTELDVLSRTENSQIAIFTHSIAAFSVLKDQGKEFAACAGFSLGEYTALVASGVISLEDGIKIILKRGQVMQEAADKSSGAMYAIIGLDDNIVEEICTKQNGIVLPVNYNCPSQLVIAGEEETAALAAEACKDAGARRALKLAVSGAFHTPLMKDAASELKAFCKDIHFKKPSIPVYTNINGEILNCEDMPSHLEQHMISPVRWKLLVNNGIENGLLNAVEIGCGKTLCGFARKISKELSCASVETMEDVISFCE